MKIAYASDVHLEHNPLSIQECDAEVVILAGDIGTGLEGVWWAIREFDKFDSVKHVFYVPGNHESYGFNFLKLVRDMKSCAQGSKVKVLYNDLVDYKGFRFLGSTLWTNFKSVGDATFNKLQIVKSINDFAYIKIDPYCSVDGRRGKVVESITTDFMELEYDKAVDFIFSNLSQEFEVTNVVITHWSPDSTPAYSGRYPINHVTSYFYNDLGNKIAYSPIKLWIHGHDHHSDVRAVGSTIITSNQRGYYDEQFELKIFHL